jgi:hypothetical protein
MEASGACAPGKAMVSAIAKSGVETRSPKSDAHSAGRRWKSRMKRSSGLLVICGIALAAPLLYAADPGTTYLSCESRGNEPLTWAIDANNKKVFGYVGRGDNLKQLAILDWSDDRIVAYWHETQNKYVFDRLTLRMTIEYFPEGRSIWTCSVRKPIL